MAKILKAEKVELTAGRIAKFHCDDGKTRNYLWCKEIKGFGVIATAAGSKSFIFQAKINGKSAHLTIGDVKVWSIGNAQKEARRLQILIDQGNDPRQVKAEEAEAKKAAIAARKAQEIRETVTVGMAWNEYLVERKPFWGTRHYNDHIDVMQTGGVIRKRNNKLTEPGVLASLAMVRLIELTPERVTEWAKLEGAKRAGRARLATRLLKAFLTWCGDHKIYKTIVIGNPAKNKKAREQLGKPESLDDVLQKQQLSAWFKAVRQIQNPVIAAYLQALLLTGARPNELASIRWADVDFQWNSMTIRDKVEGLRIIPLPPYLAHLLISLPRRNEFVFSSPTAAGGYLVDPHDAFKKACAIAGVELTLYGLRRSFATLSEWIETPTGIAAQIQGHKPSGVREKHYIRRPLDLLHLWHVKIEAWILEQAGIEFIPSQVGLQIVKQ